MDKFNRDVLPMLLLVVLLRLARKSALKVRFDKSWDCEPVLAAAPDAAAAAWAAAKAEDMRLLVRSCDAMFV